MKPELRRELAERAQALYSEARMLELALHHIQVLENEVTRLETRAELMEPFRSAVGEELAPESKDA